MFQLGQSTRTALAMVQTWGQITPSLNGSLDRHQAAVLANVKLKMAVKASQYRSGKATANSMMIALTSDPGTHMTATTKL